MLARSLSGRLLVVTILAVMVIEVVIFVPSVARYRLNYLEERLRMAELASLAILATPEGMLDAALEAELLDRAMADSIVLRRGGARGLVLQDPMARMVDETHDLRDVGPLTLIADVGRALTLPDGHVARVIGRPAPGRDVVEITIDQTDLRDALRAFGGRILLLSLAISLGTAALLYLLARRLLVKPMARLVDSMADFRDDPEDGARVIAPSSRVTEVRVAETALAEMQTQVRDALRQRARLAALGEAVAKIAHDLRNMLSTAQLLADRIEGSDDPVMARVGPKIVGSLDRAVGLCERTLRFGAAREAAPRPAAVDVAALVEEVGQAVFPEAGPVAFVNAAPPGLVAHADPDHLFRVLANLVRNARQAVERAGAGGAVTVTARRAGAAVAVDVCDDGPGLPAAAVETLFKPFHGSTSRGGSGLGLAIADELARLQGGSVRLLRNGPDGACFRVETPVATAAGQPEPAASPHSRDMAGPDPDALA